VFPGLLASSTMLEPVNDYRMIGSSFSSTLIREQNEL
jgi:hypothetical protein